MGAICMSACNSQPEPSSNTSNSNRKEHRLMTTSRRNSFESPVQRPSLPNNGGLPYNSREPNRAAVSKSPPRVLPKYPESKMTTNRPTDKKMYQASHPVVTKVWKEDAVYTAMQASGVTSTDFSSYKRNLDNVINVSQVYAKNGTDEFSLDALTLEEEAKDFTPRELEAIKQFSEKFKNFSDDETETQSTKSLNTRKGMNGPQVQKTPHVDNPYEYSKYVGPKSTPSSKPIEYNTHEMYLSKKSTQSSPKLLTKKNLIDISKSKGMDPERLLRITNMLREDHGSDTDHIYRSPISRTTDINKPRSSPNVRSYSPEVEVYNGHSVASPGSMRKEKIIPSSRRVHSSPLTTHSKHIDVYESSPVTQVYVSSPSNSSLYPIAMPQSIGSNLSSGRRSFDDPTTFESEDIPQAKCVDPAEFSQSDDEDDGTIFIEPSSSTASLPIQPGSDLSYRLSQTLSPEQDPRYDSGAGAGYVSASRANSQFNDRITSDSESRQSRFNPSCYSIGTDPGISDSELLFPNIGKGIPAGIYYISAEPSHRAPNPAKPRFPPTNGFFQPNMDHKYGQVRSTVIPDFDIDVDSVPVAAIHPEDDDELSQTTLEEPQIVFEDAIIPVDVSIEVQGGEVLKENNHPEPLRNLVAPKNKHQEGASKLDISTRLKQSYNQKPTKGNKRDGSQENQPDSQPTHSQVFPKRIVPVWPFKSKEDKVLNILRRPFVDLREFFNLHEEELARGRFGIIHVCESRETGERLACKSIRKSKLKCSQDVEDVRREVAVMEMLRGHPHVVHLKNTFEDLKFVHLVMELCEGGELFDRIKMRKHYSENNAASVIKTVVQVLKYCHSLGIMHRDLKPENILLCNWESDTKLKVIDYGVAAFFKRGKYCTDIAGSPFYLAPEVLKERYGPEADIWSAGVVLYILLSGVPPFWAPSNEGIFDAIRQAKLNLNRNPWPSISDEAKNLVSRMLTKDPKRRISVDEILAHPWLNSQ